MSSSSSRSAEKSRAGCSRMAMRLVNSSSISLPLPSLVASLKSVKSDRSPAVASVAMMCVLIWSPMSGLPLSAAMSLELALLGMIIGAEGMLAYLSLMYLGHGQKQVPVSREFGHGTVVPLGQVIIKHDLHVV